MSCEHADVHAVTIRDPGHGVAVARGHPLHWIDGEGRSWRRTLDALPALGIGHVLDTRDGRVVHTAGTGPAA